MSEVIADELLLPLVDAIVADPYRFLYKQLETDFMKSRYFVRGAGLMEDYTGEQEAFYVGFALSIPWWLVNPLLPVEGRGLQNTMRAYNMALANEDVFLPLGLVGLRLMASEQAFIRPMDCMTWIDNGYPASAKVLSNTHRYRLAIGQDADGEQQYMSIHTHRGERPLYHAEELYDLTLKHGLIDVRPGFVTKTSIEDIFRNIGQHRGMKA